MPVVTMASMWLEMWASMRLEMWASMRLEMWASMRLEMWASTLAVETSANTLAEWLPAPSCSHTRVEAAPASVETFPRALVEGVVPTVVTPFFFYAWRASSMRAQMAEVRAR